MGPADGDAWGGISIDYVLHGGEVNGRKPSIVRVRLSPIRISRAVALACEIYNGI